jgi:hypothetical protein
MVISVKDGLQENLFMDACSSAALLYAMKNDRYRTVSGHFVGQQMTALMTRQTVYHSRADPSLNGANLTIGTIALDRNLPRQLHS